MSTGASHYTPGDDATNSFAPPMNPSTTDSSASTPTPGFSFNAEMAAANGMQAGSGSTVGREGSYVPQFSAATEMILRRMRGEPTGEFDPASSPNVDGWEEAKAKVMMGMKTTMNMDMGPLPQNTGRRGSAQRAAAASRAAASRAASRRASSTPGPATGGASSASTPVTSKPVSSRRGGGSTGATPTSSSRGGRGGRGSASKGRGGRAGAKRKRQPKEDSESVEESDSMSKLGDDSSDDDGDSITNMPSMTSSGRQIQKPKNFNPVAMDGPPRKRAAPKKLQEQALCKRCGRGHSPQSNMIVFCDGCNMGWHQMCHDPVVSDEVVKDESSEWFCADCTAEREKKSSTSKSELVQTEMAQGEQGVQGSEHAAAQGQQTFIQQQQRMESSTGASAIEKSMEEKRAYLSSLPHSQLVALLLHATTIHPDLPIFPAASQQHFLGSNQSMMIPAGFYPNSQPGPQQQQQFSNNGGIPGAQSMNPRFSQQPQDRRTSPYNQQPFSSSAVQGLFPRTDTNPGAPINFIRKIPEGGQAIGNGNGIPPTQHQIQPGFYNPFMNQPQNPIPQNPQNQHNPPYQAFRPSAAPPFNMNVNPNAAISNPGTTIFQNLADSQQGNDVPLPPGEGDSSRESTPASPPYPRPGNGLMRKLPPDDQDLEWLEDTGDYDAFSHVVYDPEGRGEKIEEDGVVVVAGVGGGTVSVGVGVGIGVGMGGVL